MTAVSIALPGVLSALRLSVAPGTRFCTLVVLMFVSPALAAAASVVALKTAIDPTLMFASPASEAADSVVLMLATLGTLMFVSPANAALAPPLAQAGVDS